jgi:hypothetical protein
MGDATYAIPNFSGGEISPFAQGRFDKPDYRTSMNVCLNGFPNEIGAWTRRPGSIYAGHTRAGRPGRKIKFDFEQADAVTLEFTDGYLRFRSGATLLGTNDAVAIVAVSAANPAVVQVAAPVTWVTGNGAIFPGASTPLLENRQFTLTKIDTTHFSLSDPLTGATINGATLGALVAGATIKRVQELVTVYVSGGWATVRAVQAETTDVLLQGAYPPQALTVATMPTDDVEAQFDIDPIVFNDGPYLDPPTNGAQVTPSALSGIITLVLSFPAYSATKAYAKGAFVTSASINYRSLLDQNVGNVPAASPTYWVAVSAGEAVNDGRGFLGSDAGRLVRLFSEPDLWAVGTAYVVGNIVTFNPSGKPGASTYWQALANNTGKPPGSDLTNWEIIAQGAAQWSWGRITGLSNIIDRQLAGSVSIGNMTLLGGINAPFDGVFSKSVGSSATQLFTGGASPGGVPVTVSGFVGKNYFAAGAQKIQQATIYPSFDFGFGLAQFSIGGSTVSVLPFYTLNLRAKATVPASAADGTLLGTASFSGSSTTTNIVSNDQTTTWNYVWVELILTATPPSFAASYEIYIDIAQISFFNPTTTASSSAAVSVEILGAPLLYTKPIITWRLGVYSDTTGYPTCGCYSEGRIWLAGAVPNRFDACVSNGIDGASVDMAPTDQYGTVATSSAISYTLNTDSVNPIFSMQPELQGIIVRTQAAEYLVQAPTTGPMAAANIAARRVTRHGSANLEPCRTEHTTIFVKRYARKLLEFFSDVNFGKFSAPNIADKAGHIVSAGIAEIAYTEAVVPVVWGRDVDGALFGVTYKRDTLTTTQPPAFAAWHRHTLGTGRMVESICAGPSPGGDLDSLTMVTNDADSNIRHVEILTDTPDENTALADVWFLDNAVEPTSRAGDPTPIVGAPYGGMTLNGLWHLNGETVQVFASGVDCGDRGTGSTGYTDFVVANGSCFVPYGDGISAGSGRGLFTAAFAASARIIVGLTYNSDGQMVRPIAPADTGARTGPSLGKTRRNHRYAALLSGTANISFGTDFSALYPADFRQANGNPIADLTTFSGVHSDTIEDDYSYDGMICWRVSRPWPANLAALEGFIQTMDR